MVIRTALCLLVVIPLAHAATPTRTGMVVSVTVLPRCETARCGVVLPVISYGTAGANPADPPVALPGATSRPVMTITY